MSTIAPHMTVFRIAETAALIATVLHTTFSARVEELREEIGEGQAGITALCTHAACTVEAVADFDVEHDWYLSVDAIALHIVDTGAAPTREECPALLVPQ
jgi:hypothetical protein